MPTELKMPALSPTMEEGTLAKWLVKEGDAVRSGDVLAEIETDKATMEYEAVDEGTIEKIVVAEGTEGVKVGAVIALIAGEDGEEAAAEAPAAPPASTKAKNTPASDRHAADTPAPAPPAATDAPERSPADRHGGPRIKASPLARRLAKRQGIDLAGVTGSGAGGRIVKADLGAAAQAPATPGAEAGASPAAPAPATPPAPATTSPPATGDIPSDTVKLSNMRKVIARRLTESKQTVPHIYLTVDVRLDALLKLRSELNAALAPRDIKLSVNDLIVKAMATALVEVPAVNVMFAGDSLVRYKRADISVAVSIPGGLITPIVAGADGKGVAAIATEMQGLAARAREGKLQPHEYQGGTASLSNMGMLGITQFDAVINPPQGMILAIGAGERRPWVIDEAIGIATIMSATGSFDHRAIDGADGAAFMAAFRRIVETPLGMLA